MRATVGKVTWWAALGTITIALLVFWSGGWWGDSPVNRLITPVQTLQNVEPSQDALFLDAWEASGSPYSSVQTLDIAHAACAALGLHSMSPDEMLAVSDQAGVDRFTMYMMLRMATVYLCPAQADQVRALLEGMVP